MCTGQWEKKLYIAPNKGVKGVRSAIYKAMKEPVHMNAEDLCSSVKCSKEAVNWELLEQ